MSPTNERPSDPVDPKTRRRMSRTAQRDNHHERTLRGALFARGLRFRLHQKIVEGTRRTVDIAFIGPRVAVLIDGCFWHGCPLHGTWPKSNADWWRTKIEANIARDRDTDRRLTAAGWEVLRVWEHEPIDDAAARIAAIVAGRKSHKRLAQTRNTSAR